MTKTKIKNRRALMKWLESYVSDDDVVLDKLTFLMYVADRINDDLQARLRKETK